MVIFLSTIGTIILIVGVIGTVFLAGKKEEGYHSSTKANMTRLIVIYIVLLVGLGIGIGVYVRFF